MKDQVLDRDREASISRSARRFEELSDKYAIPYLESLLDGSRASDEALRFKAAIEILNRHLGKPREAIDISGEVTLKIDC